MSIVEKFQELCVTLDIDPGPIDGLWGPKTAAAYEQLGKTLADLNKPSTAGIYERLGRDITDLIRPSASEAYEQLGKRLASSERSYTTDTNTNTGTLKTPPWVDEMLSKLGGHEHRDGEELSDWFHTSGAPKIDPKKTAWCGYAVRAALVNSKAVSRDEIPPKFAAAVNWRAFGGRLYKPRLGAVMVFHRGDPKGWQGHVGLYVGETDSHYRILGGNQKNAICVSKIDKKRLHTGGIRWPSNIDLVTYATKLDKNTGPEYEVTYEA